MPSGREVSPGDEELRQRGGIDRPVDAVEVLQGQLLLQGAVTIHGGLGVLTQVLVDLCQVVERVGVREFEVRVFSSELRLLGLFGRSVGKKEVRRVNGLRHLLGR
ncbi:hypothetical protein MTO96_052064 [Rhipicephalus appendiculatus]